MLKSWQCFCDHHALQSLHSTGQNPSTCGFEHTALSTCSLCTDHLLRSWNFSTSQFRHDSNGLTQHSPTGVGRNLHRLSSSEMQRLHAAEMLHAEETRATPCWTMWDYCTFFQILWNSPLASAKSCSIDRVERRSASSRYAVLHTPFRDAACLAHGRRTVQRPLWQYMATCSISDLEAHR